MIEATITTFRQQPEKILFFLLLAFFLCGHILRAWFFDYSDFNYNALADHFANAVTARNISIGLGWSASGFGTLPLNPEHLTTGPTVILPASLAITLFGNTLTVSTLSVLLLNISLLLLLLQQLRQHFAQPQQFYLFAILLLALFTSMSTYYWYRILGEVTGVLLVLLAASYILCFLRSQNTRHLLLAALCCTLALGTKQLTLLPCAVLGFTLAWLQWINRHTNVPRLFGQLMLFGIVTLSLPLLALGYCYSVYASHDAQWQREFLIYLVAAHNHTSGTLTLVEYLDDPASLFQQLEKTFSTTLWKSGAFFYGAWLTSYKALTLWLVIYVATLVACLRSIKIPGLALMLTLSALPLLLWAFLISANLLPRHLYIGFFLAAAGICLWVSSLETHWLRRLLGLFLLVLIVITGDHKSRQTIVALPLEDSRQALAIHDMSNRIQQELTSNSIPVALRLQIKDAEFEYLNDTPNQFHQVEKILADSVHFDEEDFLQRYPDIAKLVSEGHYESAYAWYISPESYDRPIAKVIFHEPFAFHLVYIKDAVSKYGKYGIELKRGDLCETVAYQNDAYAMVLCTDREFAAIFQQLGGMPERPRAWVLPRYFRDNR